MIEANVHNVYKGEDSMKKFFDPDSQPPLPLVELPKCLNPFNEHGVHIFAKMMTALPCQNVKALPALNMLRKAGPSALKTIVEPSSGSTVTSISMISRVLHGNRDVYAYVSNKTEQSRLRTLQFFGLKVVLYGGPAQPEIADPRGQIHKLKKLAQDRDDIYNPGQYENPDNPEAHIRWTGPQLLLQLPQINIFCAGMGSAGCITGTGTFLKKHKPSVTVVGVCNNDGDAIPGPRPLSLFDRIAFPWKQVTDAVKRISSIESYRLSMAMSREGIICGPSSGMALKGLYEFLQDQKDLGKLHTYAEPGTGEVSCVFLCCDLPYQYMDTYFKKLGGDDFNPISNLQLAKIDQGCYDTAWELSPLELVKFAPFRHSLHFTFSGDDQSLDSDMASSAALVLDLRQTEDFQLSHVSGSLNFTLPSLKVDTPSPFDQIPILEIQFKEIEDLFNGLSSSHRLRQSDQVLVVCYTGETSRLACSVMRSRGIEAYGVEGGFHSLSQIRALLIRYTESK